jgi:parafibromin
MAGRVVSSPFQPALPSRFSITDRWKQEASRLVTPPHLEETTPVRELGEFHFHLSPPEEEQNPHRAVHLSETRQRSRSGIRTHIEEGIASPEGCSGTAILATKMARSSSPQFELNYPEHLPNSPLCPRNPMNESGGLGICVYHGRRETISTADGVIGDGQE